MLSHFPRATSLPPTRPIRLLGVGFLLALVAACDVSILDGADKTAVRAQFRETGSACEVEVLFTNSVVGLPESKPDYYRLPSGERALRATNVAGVHAVVVAFPDMITDAESIVLGSDTDTETTLAIERNTADASPAVLLAASVDANATDSIITLSFDDALDLSTASEVARYTVSGTEDHPNSATPVGCGQQVELLFDALSTQTALDIEGLSDINGMAVADVMSQALTVSEEEDAPQLESVAFPVEAPYAAVDLTFNEVVDLATVQDLAQYTLTPDGVNPVSVEILPGGRTVRLGFDAFEPPVGINASGLRDMAGNLMAAVAGVDVEHADDGTPPVPVSATPSSDGVGVVIRLTLSEAVTLLTGQVGSNYALLDETGTDRRTPTDVSMVTGTPSIDLTFDYIPAGAQLEVVDLTDLNGNTLVEPEIIPIDFENDDTAPRVWYAAFVPDSLEPAVDVGFDKQLDPTSAETAANYLFSTEEHPTSATLQSDGRTVRLVASRLATITTLSVTGVRDTAGHTTASLEGQAISTTGDTNIPTAVSAAYAADRQVPTVQLTYSEAIDMVSASATANFAASLDNQHPTSAELLDDGRTVELTFGPLSLETQVRTGDVTDLSGNSIVVTTVGIDPGSDTTAPTVLSATYVANLSAPTMDIVFSEAVNKTLAEAPALYTLGTTPTVAQSATMQSDGHTVRAIFPNASRTDKLDIRSLTDMGGNVMSTAGGVSVTAADESTKPVVVSAVFAANTASPTLFVTYSEAVDRASAQTTTNYVIASHIETATSATIQDDGHTVVAVFPPLARADQFTIKNISDLAGNVIDSSAKVTPTANGESTAPSVLTTTVTTATSATIIFSEAVDELSAETEGNYLLPGGGSVASATVQGDGRTVIIVATGTTLASGSTITISNVKDLNGNTMSAAIGRTMN